MRGGTPHQLDEMPVLACRVAVALYVADQLGVSLGSRVKTEGCLDLVVFQVAVDGLRAADDLYAVLLGSIILCQYTGVGVGVVTADDDNGFDVQLADNFKSFLELVFLFQLGSAGTDHVKAARIAVRLKVVCCDFHIVVVNKPARSHEETIETVLRVQLFDFVE